MIPLEVIKEFKINIEGLDHAVKGRVVKSVKGDFSDVFLGEFSHLCKPHKGASDVYSPDISRQDVDQAINLVLNYLESFTTIDVKPNKRY